MSRIIGDRTRNTLDEMEEVARARNKDVAEEERLEALRKAKEAVNGKAPPVIIPKGDIMPLSYNGLEFESFASGNKEVRLAMTFDASLERIKSENYERHASPAEIFSLIMGKLEGKLPKDLKALADEVNFSNDNWLSMAFEREGDLLIAYLHPEGLAWDEDKYVKQDCFKYSEKGQFDIAGKSRNEWTPLQKMGDDFSLFVYGRKFNDLPEEMRNGSSIGKAATMIIEDKAIWPISRFGGGFSIVGSKEAGSRGVRVGGSQ